MSMLCGQCGAAAERCEACGGPLCARRLCAELHEASCAAVRALPPAPVGVQKPTYQKTPNRPQLRRRERNPEAERVLAQELVQLIAHHRHTGRAALLAGDLETALDELWAARLNELDFDRLGPVARTLLPADWEFETDLTPVARALAARRHRRAADAWRRVMDDRPARSIQAEAAEWLAADAFAVGQRKLALRILHAGSQLGRATPPDTFRSLYQQAGIDPATAFKLYLAAIRLEPGTARAVLLRDPLTESAWSDQDSRWWLLPDRYSLPSEPKKATDHRSEALGRARDLAASPRDEGWVLLAEGDFAAGPLDVRSLGRNVRAGRTEAADEDTFVRIRLAYEGAAERLPDVAWPWYRLAELLAWAGFQERAQAHLAEAERRSLGGREVDRTERPLLRAFVEAGLGYGPNGLPTTARPFPAEPFAPRFAWRLRFR